MSKHEKKSFKPKYRFSEFVSDGEWESLSLDEISERITDKVGDSQLTTLSISAGLGFVSQAEKFSRDISGNQYSNYIRLKKGEFSYNKGNSKKYPQGCIYELKEYKEAAVPNAFISFRFNKGCVPNFYKGYFDNNFHGKQLQKFITSGARSDGLLNINANEFLSIILPTPKKEAEQQKIADCLTSLDELIAAEDKKLGLLKAHKKGLMQKLFPAEGKTVPKVRFEGYTDTWEQKKLGEIYNIYSGQTPFRGDLDNFLNPTTAWIKTTDLNNASIIKNEENISDKALKKLKLLPVGTVLIAMYGGFNQIGRTGMLTYPATINQAISALPPVEDVDPYFLITDLNHRVDEWRIVAASSRKDANITKKDVENFLFRYPKLSEQIAISTFFLNLDELISEQVKKIETLKLHKKGLMQGLFPSAQEVFA